MRTEKLSTILNGLNLMQAKYFIEQTSGLKVEKIQDFPFLAMYNVIGDEEINKISVTIEILGVDKVKALYCFNN